MLIWIFRLFFAVFGGLFGYEVGIFIQQRAYFVTEEIYKNVLIVIISVIVFATIGFFMGNYLGRRTQRTLARIEENIGRLPGSDVLAIVAGFVFSLIVALLLSIPFFFIPVVGKFISIFIIVVAAYIGVRLSIRNKERLRHLLRIRERGVKGSSQERVLTLKILDSSVLIDGRIADICSTGFVEGELVIPNFVLSELQEIADSSDSLKRNKGRAGLDVAKRLQGETNVKVTILNEDFSQIPSVDAKLITLAKKMNASIITNDYNLNKVADLQGVKVLNINDLSNAIKPIVLPGEKMMVNVIKEGKEADQGVAYLDDGTMVVVEEGKKFVGTQVEVSVTGVLQTPAGRMIFAKFEES
ncbi:MAG: PIN domain nuclease [Actinobacteria bacterium]|nr:PIN domain nuclease [Actinomycetota bacterium]